MKIKKEEIQKKEKKKKKENIWLKSYRFCWGSYTHLFTKPWQLNKMVSLTGSSIYTNAQLYKMQMYLPGIFLQKLLVIEKLNKIKLL